MNPLKQATVSNNEGVRLLSSGNITAAIQLFQDAMFVVQNFGQSYSAAEEASFHARPRRSECSRVYHGEQRPTRLAGLQTGLLYVYDRPQLIPTDPKFSNQQEFDSFLLIAGALILFNLALSCHQIGRSRDAKDL